MKPKGQIQLFNSTLLKVQFLEIEFGQALIQAASFPSCNEIGTILKAIDSLEKIMNSDFDSDVRSSPFSVFIFIMYDTNPFS